jgi:hypothetical protein
MPTIARCALLQILETILPIVAASMDTMITILQYVSHANIAARHALMLFPAKLATSIPVAVNKTVQPSSAIALTNFMMPASPFVSLAIIRVLLVTILLSVLVAQLHAHSLLLPVSAYLNTMILDRSSVQVVTILAKLALTRAVVQVAITPLVLGYSIVALTYVLVEQVTMILAFKYVRLVTPVA